MREDIIDWRRLFGLMLWDFFIDSLFEMELEKDLSLKQQVLDAWAIDELLDHLVTYHKQVRPSMNRLIPMEKFHLLGVSARLPNKLRNEAQWKYRQQACMRCSGERTSRISSFKFGPSPATLSARPRRWYSRWYTWLVLAPLALLFISTAAEVVEYERRPPAELLIYGPRNG